MTVFSWLVILSLLFLCFWKSRCPKGFPPGPWHLPLIGNLLQVRMGNLLKDLDQLAKKYGPVFSLYLGGTPVVFTHGFPPAKEVLVIKGTEFAGRADFPIMDAINKKKGILSTKYGEVWKEQRRFSLMFLRNFGVGKKSMEEKILEEATYLIEAFTEKTSTFSGDRMGWMGNRHFSVHSLSMGHNSVDLQTDHWLYNAVLLVRRLPLPHQALVTTAKKIDAFVEKEVEEHKATMIPGEPRDFTDAYLEEMQKAERKGSSFEEEQLRVLLSELFIAGTETTAGTIQWGFLYLMAFPEIQVIIMAGNSVSCYLVTSGAHLTGKYTNHVYMESVKCFPEGNRVLGSSEKCWKEIDTVLGNNASLKYEDRENLPYTNAVIHEIQRISNVVPLGIPHAPIQDVQLFGYKIPKDTMVFVNLHSAHFDESQWKFPDEFNPSNFLNEKGEFVNTEAFFAFSAGKYLSLSLSLS
ncbi:cytochrome P450 2J6-like, partial [Python bivittatus]|uniref:Cytochrome P450 2J6-like n=1 Tax=Python bivittatus TaxID=176946 RepID=A0A9F5J356_PYTBI